MGGWGITPQPQDIMKGNSFMIHNPNFPAVLLFCFVIPHKKVASKMSDKMRNSFRTPHPHPNNNNKKKFPGLSEMVKSITKRNVQL